MNEGILGGGVGWGWGDQDCTDRSDNMGRWTASELMMKEAAIVVMVV